MFNDKIDVSQISRWSCETISDMSMRSHAICWKYGQFALPYLASFLSEETCRSNSAIFTVVCNGNRTPTTNFPSVEGWNCDWTSPDRPLPGRFAFPNRVWIAMEKIFLGAIFCSTPACLLHSAINRALMAAAWVVAARIGVWKTRKPINTDHGVSKRFFDILPKLFAFKRSDCVKSLFGPDRAVQHFYTVVNPLVIQLLRLTVECS